MPNQEANEKIGITPGIQVVVTDQLSLSCRTYAFKKFNRHHKSVQYHVNTDCILAKLMCLAVFQIFVKRSVHLKKDIQ